MADSRRAIDDARKALRQQFRAAMDANEMDSAEQIGDRIKALTAQLDELSRISLDALEASDEVQQTIRQLGNSADALEDEAARITNLADALKKGAEFVQRATEIVGALRGLLPIPS